VSKAHYSRGCKITSDASEDVVDKLYTAVWINLDLDR